MKKIAAIDIGTNSVLLTIANENFEPILEQATITRLGEGLSTSKIFKNEAINRTLQTLIDYKNTCDKIQTDEVIVVGTAAMRKSENSNEFISIVREKTGLEIQVISGEEEARLTFKAVEKDFSENSIVIDIGGGSTEFITKDNKNSIHLGCVILHEKCVSTDPINKDDYNKLNSEITSQLATVRTTNDERRTTNLIATAGTATTLAAMKLKLEKYNHSEIHGYKLTVDDLDKIIEKLKSKTIEERKKIPGLEPKRADVILPGALILKATMEQFEFDEVTVSDRGVRWGLIYESK